MCYSEFLNNNRDLRHRQMSWNQVLDSQIIKWVDATHCWVLIITKYWKPPDLSFNTVTKQNLQYFFTSILDDFVLSHNWPVCPWVSQTACPVQSLLQLLDHRHDSQQCGGQRSVSCFIHHFNPLLAPESSVLSVLRGSDCWWLTGTNYWMTEDHQTFWWQTPKNKITCEVSVVYCPELFT